MGQFRGISPLSSMSNNDSSLCFAFPKEMSTIGDKYPHIFHTFYSGIKEEKGIKEYLASDRRLPYSMGLFRHYPELDRQ